jgi:acetyltransferase-like isoleucine patch superfamily enzyme
LTLEEDNNNVIFDTNIPDDSPIKKEHINLQYHWYLSIFIIIYYISYVIPGIIFMYYILLFFIPNFLRIDSLITVFTNMEYLFSFFMLPVVLVFSYFIHLLLVALITRIFWRITEKISPSKDGIIPRNIASKTANLYHIRSFMIKYGKNAFVKGILPWLSNWFFNFVGASVIGKGSTLEESVVNDRNSIVGKNCYVGVNSALSSHFVEGIFGNIVYFKIKLGDNVTLGGFNNIAPGCEISDNSYLLPMAAATKHNTTKGDNYYFGMPLRRIFKKKIMEYLQVTEEDLDRAEELRNKQKTLNIEKISEENLKE